MTWRIRLAHDGEEPGLAILGVLTAQLAWKRLSKPARKAVEDAYPDGQVKGHPLTLTALSVHGFIEIAYVAEADTNYAMVLTEAGKHCARWNLPAESTTNGGNQ